jgi:arylsulfatase A-like enzyme
MSSISVRQTTAKRPNIILIVMDAARASSLSCYGYHRPTTPNLERFAERCVVYETAISPAGWSLPSHASIFTGLYPSRHGAHDQHKYLRPEIPTMAELLRSWGYRTLAFCHNLYVGAGTGLDRGFEEFNRSVERVPPSLRRVVRRVESGVAALRGLRDSGARSANKQVSAALRRLQADEQPFFMFVHYEEPHAPYRPPRKYTRYLPDGVSLEEAQQVNQDRWEYLSGAVPMDGRDFDILTALYDSEITYLDTRVAQLLRWLEESGVLDQTMVIITADHGENVGDHQMMGHAYCLYDTLVHVPLIIHYPRGTVTPGRVEHQVQTLDALPTILAMLGDTSSEVYRSLQGYDLLSSSRHDFTFAEQAKPDLSIFHERFPGVDVSRYDRDLKMVRTDRYKYIWSSDGDLELYDLQSDPEEQCNTVREHPGVAEDLDRHLMAWCDSFEAATPLDEVPEFDEQVKDRLRALGYLE